MDRLRQKLADLGRSTVFVPVVLFVLSLAAYLPTLPRTVSFEDSGEFVTVAAVLGIPHPSSYPLYVLLAHVFSWLPFGTIPWRIALFSAVCAAAAVAAAYWIAERAYLALRGSVSWLEKIAIASILLQAAYSSVWWGQALYAQVYPLHALLLSLVVVMLIRYAAASSPRRLFWFFLFVGLAGANHLFLAAASLPLVILAAVLIELRAWTSGHAWRSAVGGLALGLSPYLYLPLAAWLGAPFIFQPAEGLSGFLDLVFRRHQDFGLLSYNKISLVGVSFWHLAVYLGPLVIGLAAVGGFLLLRTRRLRVAWVAGLASLGIVFGAPLTQLLRASALNETTEYLARVYSVGGYLFLAVLAAVGAAAAVRSLTEPGRRLFLRLAAAVFLLALPILFIANNLVQVAAYSDGFVEAYSRRVLETLPPDAVLVVKGGVFTHDTVVLSLAYLRVVEHLRPDVTIVEDSGMSCFTTPVLPVPYDDANLRVEQKRLLAAVLADERFAGRPLFLTFAADSLVSGWRSRADGLHFEFLRDGTRRDPGPGFEPPVLPAEAELADQPALRQFVANVLYAKAARAIEATADSQRSLDDLTRAMRYDLVPGSADYQGFVAHRFSVLKDRGLIADDPTVPVE
ncbi:MAG: DUF2723 domain-containing protein [Patescibacteria group bacterium]